MKGRSNKISGRLQKTVDKATNLRAGQLDHRFHIYHPLLTGVFTPPAQSGWRELKPAAAIFTHSAHCFTFGLFLPIYKYLRIFPHDLAARARQSLASQGLGAPCLVLVRQGGDAFAVPTKQICHSQNWFSENSMLKAKVTIPVNPWHL